MTSVDIELAVARLFGWRQNIIVPNVSWGWRLNHEADMLIVRPSGWVIEVEIKTTASDIKADRAKKHCHGDHRIKFMYFAVPKQLAAHADIPGYAGVISVDGVVGDYVAQIIRSGQVNPHAEKISSADKIRLLELGVMRVWSLKSHRAHGREGMAGMKKHEL